MSIDAAFLERVRARAAERRRRMSWERLEEHVKPDSWRRERLLLALTRNALAFGCALRRRAEDGSALVVEDADARRYAPTREPPVGPRWHALAAALKQGGADVLFVETDVERAHGALDDLRSVEFTGLPRIRSDWLLDEAMVLESCSFGADGVVLRPAIADDALLARLAGVCRDYGIFALHAVATQTELERALAHAPDAVLADARVPGLLEALAERAPAGVVRGAHGALGTLDALRGARTRGAQVLVPSQELLRAPDPAVLLGAWRAALLEAGSTSAG